METKAPPQWTYGERLQKARESADIKIEDMAARLNVPTSTLYKWENDISKPRMGQVELARRYEAHTGYPAAWILDLMPTTPSERPSPWKADQLELMPLLAGAAA